MGVTYTFLCVVLGPSIRLPCYLAYSAILGLILITDIERRWIPNVVVYPAILLGAAAAFLNPSLDPWRAFAGGAAGFAIYLLIATLGNALYGSEAMGAGDVKLATFIGLITGFPLVFVAAIVAIFAAGGTGLVLLLTRVRRRRDPIPYSPFLVTGVVVAALWGELILESFLP